MLKTNAHDLKKRIFQATLNEDINMLREALKEWVKPEIQKTGIKLQTKWGCTPAYYAAMTGNVEAISLLHEAGEPLDKCNISSGTCPSHCAAMKNHKNVIEKLHKAGVSFDSEDIKGNTPADSARKNGHINLAKRIEELLQEQKNARPSPSTPNIKQKKFFGLF